jgi:predicted ATPase
VLKAIEFHNFKVIRNATLPLARCTLMIGPNGSGKSTALQALQAFGDHQRNPQPSWSSVCSFGCRPQDAVEVILHGTGAYEGVTSAKRWEGTPPKRPRPADPRAGAMQALDHFVRDIRVFALDAEAIRAPAPLRQKLELDADGKGLAAVLDKLQGTEPELWSQLNEEFERWFPEYDRVLIDVEQHAKVFLLRTRREKHKVAAKALSQGTLIALAILTIAYLPDVPQIVGFEEPDRGLHPRLLRDVQQALYRLAYPEQFGASRHSVQVIATTHSPYLLDLFREHPDEVVVCEKLENNVRFTRLSDMPNVSDILDGASLGEVWYSGALGGVPATP